MQHPPLAGVALTFLCALTQAQPQPRTPPPTATVEAAPAVRVRDFDVFLDPPTGFVFVKLPQGWKFVGKVDGAALGPLPPNVLTSLLPDEREGTGTGGGGPGR